MPPKKANEPSKKTVVKQKEKLVEDKTFGLKNKKGNKNQQYIQQVKKQVFQDRTTKESEKAREEKEAKKLEKKKQLEELTALFKPVTELQKCAKGVDPKSVLCVYFKQGLCTKGDKCKFSHDLMIERKTEKRSLYDANAASSSTKDNGMMDWDQAQLEDAVNKKHGVRNKALPATTIICKHFLDAVENSKYGWFWECPGGDKCHYIHALPPGFVLKKDKKRMDEQKEVVSLEELIEKERQAIGLQQTRVTWETFSAWKRKKKEEKVSKHKADIARKESEYKSGKTGGISGRQLFEFDPTLVMGEDDEIGETFNMGDRERNDDSDNEYDGPVKEINLADFQNGGAIEIDESLFDGDIDLEEGIEQIDLQS